jgi:hypothetical protein
MCRRLPEWPSAGLTQGVTVATSAWSPSVQRVAAGTGELTTVAVGGGHLPISMLHVIMFMDWVVVVSATHKSHIAISNPVVRTDGWLPA